MEGMVSLRRILPVLLILGLALGTAIQAAGMGLMAGMASIAAVATDRGDMSRCEGCLSSQNTDMKMTGCQGGICIVLPGVLPNASGSVPVALGGFSILASTTVHGLSPPPDQRPPILASLA